MGGRHSIKAPSYPYCCCACRAFTPPPLNTPHPRLPPPLPAASFTRSPWVGSACVHLAPQVTFLHVGVWLSQLITSPFPPPPRAHTPFVPTPDSSLTPTCCLLHGGIPGWAQHVCIWPPSDCSMSTSGCMSQPSHFTLPINPLHLPTTQNRNQLRLNTWACVQHHCSIPLSPPAASFTGESLGGLHMCASGPSVAPL